MGFLRLMWLMAAQLLCSARRAGESFNFYACHLIWRYLFIMRPMLFTFTCISANIIHLKKSIWRVNRGSRYSHMSVNFRNCTRDHVCVGSQKMERFWSSPWDLHKFMREFIYAHLTSQLRIRPQSYIDFKCFIIFIL